MKPTSTLSIALRQLLFLVLLSLAISCDSKNSEKAEEKSETSKNQEQTEEAPNIVIVLCDDMGYGDLKLFHEDGLKTPNLEALAENGLVLDNFYVGSAVCSPSRAALLTGCYPPRVGLPNVLAPHGIDWAKERWRKGLNPEEETLPELLKQVGYSTGIVGKWHLGHMPEHMPTNHGFDYFYGLPYSNDMLPKIGYPPLPIIDQDSIVEENPDQRFLTRRLTEMANAYIEKQEGPFFLYLAHPMPHVPIFTSDSFKNKSKVNEYYDVIAEIDWSVGQVVKTLKAKGMFENTIIMFTSDNGPWLCFGNHAGSSGDLREGKKTTFDGGQRVPFIMSWPKKLQGRRSSEILSTMDVLPSLLQWAGAPMPKKEIDGLDASSFLTGGTENSPRETLLYYHSSDLEAIRSGDYKVHLAHGYKKQGSLTGNDGERGQYDEGKIGLSLFNMAEDPGETKDLSSEKPELVDSLVTIAKKKAAAIDSSKREPYVYSGKAPPVGKLWH